MPVQRHALTATGLLVDEAEGSLRLLPGRQEVRRGVAHPPQLSLPRLVDVGGVAQWSPWSTRARADTSRARLIYVEAVSEAAIWGSARTWVDRLGNLRGARGRCSTVTASGSRRPPRPTRPSRSARSSTSPTSSAHADPGSGPSSSRSRCSTSARPSRSRAGGWPVDRVTARARSTSTCCCSATASEPRAPRASPSRGHGRRFVLMPLLELNPELALPDGTRLTEALEAARRRAGSAGGRPALGGRLGRRRSRGANHAGRQHRRRSRAAPAAGKIVQLRSSAHAARRRRRQHPDPRRGLRGLRAGRRLALRDPRRLDRRRARAGDRRVARVPRPASSTALDWRDRLDRRSPARPRVPAAQRAPPRGSLPARRPVDQDRHADPDRQPARARLRPPRQRRRRLRAGRRPLHLGRLRHLDQLRRRLRGAASTWAA